MANRIPTSEMPRTYPVLAREREPLIRFIADALEGAGCRLIHRPPADRAPFRFTFETADGERLGIVAYAFLANRKPTKNRPHDEHRFQVKYGSKDGRLHEIWQDPFGLCHAPPSWGHPFAKVMGPGGGARRPTRLFARHGVRVEPFGGRRKAPDVCDHRATRERRRRPGCCDLTTGAAGGGVLSIVGFSLGR